MSELPKTYEPQAIEEKWYAWWQEQRFFVADPQSPKPPYSIVIPPPNVTGVLTLGHVLNNTIQDILARRARMLGKEVLWLPGTDHAGIATQTVVERTLKKQGEIRHRDDLGREKFIEKVWQWKEKHGGIIIQQLKKLGASCDWSRERFTMDPAYSECVQRVFVDLYKKGLIYRGKRMVNWDPAALTALSDEEVTMKPQNGVLYQFKVEVAGAPGTFLSIATTRPETIPGDTAVAVNPKDPRYTHLIGQQVVRPLPPELPVAQRLIPIVGDEHVDFAFGTGVLKVTPAHDKADFDIGQRHHLAAPDVMNPNGTMNALAGQELNGKDRFAARELAVERLRTLGLLEKEEPYQNNVGFSERTDVPVEPRLSEQWFLKYPSVEKARASVETTCAPGSESLKPHPAPEKLGFQPIPGAPVTSASGPDYDTAPAFQSHVSANTQPELTPSNAEPLPEKRSTSNDDSARQMRFFPERWAKVYEHWLENIQDWCISRQLWWGHQVPVWYSEACPKMGQEIEVVHLHGDELQGRDIKQLRASAFQWARQHGFLGQDFLNLETGRSITIRRASLEHAFANFGTANVKLVPGLPQLIRHAILVAVSAHEPPAREITAVETYYACVHIGQQRFRVRFTVKVYHGVTRLYDHQTLILCETKKMESGGDKSPEEASLSASFALRPAPDPKMTLAELCPSVNGNKDFQRCQIGSPGAGWTQDTDVLDTWFSSWLWPFATMGWPEKTGTLAKFYPTTDLVTAPDIIFFWVARMIMAGFEFMGELPFRNVYFTGLIRDKQGRKMSKSLGNSPDPLDLIGQYGADALRFGIMRSAPLGQDIAYDEKNVELGRNFCTKLWNAARFRQMHGGATEGEINPVLLNGDDRWILRRLDEAISEVTAALEGYQFSEAAQALYRFFWTEFCDWYLEASKASLFRGNEEQKANTLAVLDFVLAHTLRLFHPFMPFITEELWQGMGYREDLPEGQGGRTICYAPWPARLGQDFEEYYGLEAGAEQGTLDKQALVAAGRGLRRDSSVPFNKKVRFILKPTGELTAYDAEVLKLLLNAEALELNAGFVAEKGTPTALTPLGELSLPLAGLIDVAAEKTRLAKEVQKVEQELDKVTTKLSNESFVGSAPPQVVEEHRRRRSEWQVKLEQLQKLLAAL